MCPAGRPIAVLLALAAPLAAQDLLRTQFGATPDSQFGASVDVRDDFDADGIPDIVIGEPNFHDGQSFAGRVVVSSGATGAVLGSYVGGTLHRLGAEVASAGDLDGDGVSDVLASSPYYGTNTGIVSAISITTGTLLWSVVGTAGAQLGWSIASLDDVDGDGRRDVLVIATGPWLAAARVLSGANGSYIRAHGPIFGTIPWDCIALDDADGDGVGEYAISRVHGESRVTIYSGASGAVMHTILSSGTAGFGVEMQGLGDVDGDGVRDLAVGIPIFPGTVRVFSPVTGALIRTLQAHGCGGDGFGNRLGPAGDMDLDGVDDLWMGTSGGEYAKLISVGTGAELLTFRGGMTYLYCASALHFATLPDQTGDGRPEIVVASNCAIQSSPAVGPISVYAGTVDNVVGSNGCFGDGTGSACPCANTGAAGGGCANSTGAGARLIARGSVSVSSDGLWLEIRNLPYDGLRIVFAGTDAVNGGLGSRAFDGLNCAGGRLRRLQNPLGCETGGWVGPGLRGVGLWTAGSTRHFQAFYRDRPGPCAAGANFTNLVTVTFGA